MYNEAKISNSNSPKIEMETRTQTTESSLDFQLQNQDIKALPQRNPVQALTKEEKAERRRNDRIAHERDRERKRAKRQNPAYRMMEQRRDRERKKLLRSDETFRALEKIRDRMRKEQKRYYAANSKNIDESITVADPLYIGSLITDPLMEPEVILSTFEHQPNLCNQKPPPKHYNSQTKIESPPSKDDL